MSITNDVELTINREEVVLDDAQNIDSIINNIDLDMEELNKLVESKIPNVLDTDWAINWKEHSWKSYYNTDLDEAMNEMGLSAKNLRAAVANALENSKEA